MQLTQFQTEENLTDLPFQHLIKVNPNEHVTYLINRTPTICLSRQKKNR